MTLLLPNRTHPLKTSSVLAMYVQQRKTCLCFACLKKVIFRLIKTAQ